MSNNTGSKCREEADVCAHIKDTVSFFQLDAVLQVSPFFEDLAVQEGNIPLTNTVNKPTVREKASFGCKYRESPFRKPPRSGSK